MSFLVRVELIISKNGNRMNILYIAHERNMGGASKCLLDLAVEMKKKGHNVYVLVPIKNCRVQKELEKKGIVVFSMFFLWWQYPMYWSKCLKLVFRMSYFLENFSVLRAGKYIKEYKIDIIHSNSSVIDFGMKISKRYHIKHIWHFREFGDLDYQLEYFRGKEKSLSQINKSGSQIIFISKRVYLYYQKWIEKSISHVIYDGIDLKYSQYKKKTDYGKTIFLIAGNLHRNKRQDLVISAAHILIREGITQFEVWVAGQTSAMRDSKKYEQELHMAAMDIPDNIRFVGFVENMIELRQKVDVEIVASSEEAFGRVTVEAMLSSIPVIGSDSGATPEIITDNATGFLFENGNVISLASKMKEIIADTNQIEILGKNAFSHARNTFSLEKNISSIEEVYRMLNAEITERNKF